MKHLFSVIFIALATTVLAQESEKNITQFRNIPWGAPIDSIYVNGKKLDFLKDKNSLVKNTYYIANDDMTIGNVRLTRVNYIFNDEGRFYKVQVEGPKEDAGQMRFILEYKFGVHKNESRVDGVNIKQWVIKGVTFTLGEYDTTRFELKIESDWQATEAYKKNTSVDDF